MRKIKISAILTTIVFVICLAFIYQAPLRYGNIVFSMNDKKYDDNGAGKIQYPKNLSDEKGLFDITNFTVKSTKEDILFEYNLSDINNKYNNKNGFSNVLVDTYISVSDKGMFAPIEYGAAVSFNESYPWTYHIKITPESYYMERIIDAPKRVTEKIDVKLEVKGTKLIIKTNKNNIKEDLKRSKYYVFTGGYDIFGSDGYRRVVMKESEWDFYGGIESLYQPNVIDIVSPLQSRMLTYFMPPIYSVLSPVFNQTHQLIFRKELLYLLTLIFFAFKYFSIYKKYKSCKEESIDSFKINDEDSLNIDESTIIEKSDENLKQKDIEETKKDA